MNKPEYVWQNPDDASSILQVYGVDFGDRRTYIVTLRDTEIGTDEIEGNGTTINEALWDMTGNNQPVRSYAINALFERYINKMGEWPEEDVKLLNIEHDYTSKLENFYRENDSY